MMTFLWDAWEHYWSRVLLLVLTAAALTGVSGFIAWACKAFKLDRDDIRNADPSRAAEIHNTTAEESWALPSQEPLGTIPDKT